MPRGLMRWSPMRDLDRFFEDDFWSGVDFVPAMDVYQDKDNVIVESALSGIDPEKVDITIENDVLTISGSTESKSEVKKEDYYRKEIREGSFSRSVILPMSVKADQAEAHSDKGILRITIPKAEEAKPKKNFSESQIVHSYASSCGEADRVHYKIKTGRTWPSG